MDSLFKEKGGRYDKREVDMYIGRLRGEYEKISESHKQLTEKLNEYEASQNDLRELLISAHSAANAIRREAEEAAEAIMEETKEKAARILSDSKIYADYMLAVAHRDASEIKSHSLALRKDMNTIYERLTSIQPLFYQ